MQPLLIDDIDQLRYRLLNSETTHGRSADLWRLIVRCARSAPFSFPWFTPFVAVITRDPRDIAHAAEVIRRYVSKLDSMYFSTGLQFHFWCFAFPHAKWSLYFQWLCTLDAFDDAEAKHIAEQFIEYHFVNFLYGMRTKPEPECVDNQALSLALSATLLGYVFTQPPHSSQMATLIRDEGLRRLPVILGDMPPSGYSGEGSSYMDCVNGPAVALAVELLERITDESNLLHRPFTLNGATPYAVLKMVAYEWMPGSLLLPWDNYGYQFGVRAPLAYAAKKTGEALFSDILEHEALWSYDIGTGWAYDDLPWTLIWWPDSTNAHTPKTNRSWFQAHVGGALVSTDRQYYAMQMWDASTPVVPTRAHVNPNALLFNAHGVPLSADGSPTSTGAARFKFADTVRQVNFLTMGQIDEYNYGDGCGGAHSVMLVDGWEGMRNFADGPQIRASSIADTHALSLMCDVAPTYQERWPDIASVCRRTTLCAQRFFVVEDMCRATEQHQWTQRFVLRPSFVPTTHGVKIQSPEGVVLHLIPVLVDAHVVTESVTGHPAKPDGCCGIADFVYHGTHMHQLTLAWMASTRQRGAQIRHFSAIADETDSLTYADARLQLQASTITLDMQLPPYMEADVAIIKRWWYRVIVAKPENADWIQLPLGMLHPRLWLNDEEIDLTPYRQSAELIAPHVTLPSHFFGQRTLDIVMCVDVPISHYEGGGDGTIGLSGGVWWIHPIEEEEVISCHLRDGTLIVQSSHAVYVEPYSLQWNEESR